MTRPRLVAVQAGPVWIAYHYSDGKAAVVRVDPDVVLSPAQVYYLKYACARGTGWMSDSVFTREEKHAGPSLSTTPNPN